ncbi:RHS repeat-associated core domain-containing protein [Streptomyces sp. NPDC002159]
MTEAWTPNSADCTPAPTTAALGGAAPYWNSYTYKDSGLRDTSTVHTAAGNTTTTYAYGTPNGQPHALSKTTVGTTTTGSYVYDKTGNTTTRPGTQATQTLTWNSEGKLATSSEPAAGSKPATGTKYLYDADGTLLIRRPTTTDGETVLYLGATEVHLKVTGSGATKALTGSRYYSAAGQTIAVRTSSTKVTFLAGDNHGTSSLAFEAGTSTLAKRYTSPFGASRGTPAPTWPDDKAFLGAPSDSSTGLTHLGAREYDPTTGRFISVDPLLTADQQQSLNGYTYANNNPATESDPTGLCPVDLCGGGEGKGGSTSGEVTKVDPSSPVYWPVPQPEAGGKPKKDGTAQVTSNGQTMWNDDGQYLSCAYGHCIGNVGTVDVDRYIGNFFFGIGQPITTLIDIASLLISPSCAVEGECITKQYNEWGARHGWDADSPAAALGASVPFLKPKSPLGGGRWKVGEDYSKPTKNGRAPSMSTMRKRFWKNEAAEPDAADQYGAANISRMKRGMAPRRQRPDGSWESMELSHEPIPERDGGMLLTPRWPKDHVLMDPGGHRRLPPGY